jgi:hypothetical protein
VNGVITNALVLTAGLFQSQPPYPLSRLWHWRALRFAFCDHFLV